ncbi:MAG: DUF4838 domain-containing protein, partial [Candidatus Lokiarchaeota archaeon]|nr:DUF4838 domain-containing protein [Candidatus Lokiarchaeota archaeon]
PYPKFLSYPKQDLEGCLEYLFKDLQGSKIINIILDIDKNLQQNSKIFDILLNLDGNEQIDCYITGLNPQKLMEGCYTLLYRLGIRWYFPCESCYFLRSYKKFPIDLFAKNGVDNRTHIIENPSFNKRGVVLFDNNDIYEDWLKFLIRNRMNYIGLHSEQGLEKAKTIIENFGINVSLEKHVFKRKICSQDRQEFEQAIENINKLLPRIPESHYSRLKNIKELYLWLADSMIKKCKCDRHKAMSASETYLDFVNHAIKSINQSMETVTINMCYLAYLGSFEKVEKIRPNSNVILEIAPIHRCFSHNLYDSNCKINKIEVSSVIKSLCEVFKDNDKQVLGYWLDSSLFGRFEFQAFGWALKYNQGRIPHIPFIMQEDLKFYKEHKVDSIMTFAAGINSQYLAKFTSPMIFLFTELLWNVKLDLKTEMADFCRYYLKMPDFLQQFNQDERIDPKDLSRAEFKKFITSWETKKKDLIRKRKGRQYQINDKILDKLIEEANFIQRWRKRYFLTKIFSYFQRLIFKISKKLS